MVENGIISTMGLNIKNSEVEQLAAEVAKLMGTTKTEAIRRVLYEKSIELGVPQRKTDHSAFHAFLEDLWQKYPSIKGKKFTKQDYDAIYE